MRSLFLVAFGLVACNTPVRPEKKDEPAVSAVRAAEPAPKPSALGTASPLSGKIALSSGATLDMPAGAEAVGTPGDLPSEVKRTQVYKFADESRLMVNELTFEGASCDAARDLEWTKMKAAEGDTDAERLKYRRMQSVEKIEIAGRPAILSVATHGTGNPGENASLATLILCTPKDYVVAMIASKNAERAADVKATLLAMGKSYQAK